MQSSNLTTSNSVRKYLDLCKDWLVSPPQEERFEELFLNVPFSFNMSSNSKIGMVETELRNVTEFKCNICSTEDNLKLDGKCLIVNPFTRAQLMVICNKCFSSI